MKGRDLMKIKKMVALICIFSLMISLNVHAYNYTGYRWEKTSIQYYYTNSIFATGAAAWSGLDAKLSYGSTYYDINCYTVSSPNAAWDGISYIGHDMLHINSVTININTAASKTWNNSNAVKSVVAHEFGHALGLDENGSTRTIMNDHTWGTNSRYETYKLTTPQSDDKTGINAIY